MRASTAVRTQRHRTGPSPCGHRTVGPEITVEPMVGAAGLWSTLVDPGQLENALLNLCINARDAMPERRQAHHRDRQPAGSTERTPRHARDLPPGQYVSLSRLGHRHRHDARGDRQRAFDPFFTTKPIGQGTGLGSVDGLRLRQAVRRPGADLLRGRAGHDGVPLPAAVTWAEVETGVSERQADRAGAGETVLVVDDELDGPDAGDRGAGGSRLHAIEAATARRV